MTVDAEEALVDFFELPATYVGALYVIAVLVAAPAVKKWKEFDMDKPSIKMLHNIVTCVGNLTVAAEMIVCMAGNKSVTSLIDHRNHFPRVFDWLIVLKFWELFSTAIIILQMQWRRLTVFHVYYNLMMFLLADGARVYGAVPAVGFFFTVQCFLQFFVYTYFFFSEAIRFPKWVRQLLTIVQILGYFALLVHAIEGYQVHGYCIYHPIFCATLVVGFCHHYYTNFISKTAAPEREKYSTYKRD